MSESHYETVYNFTACRIWIKGMEKTEYHAKMTVCRKMRELDAVGVSSLG